MHFQNTGFFRKVLECFLNSTLCAEHLLCAEHFLGVGDATVNNLNKDPALLEGTLQWGWSRSARAAVTIRPLPLALLRCELDTPAQELGLGPLPLDLGRPSCPPPQSVGYGGSDVMPSRRWGSFLLPLSTPTWTSRHDDRKARSHRGATPRSCGQGPAEPGGEGQVARN